MNENLSEIFLILMKLSVQISFRYQNRSLSIIGLYVDIESMFVLLRSDVSIMKLHWLVCLVDGSCHLGGGGDRGIKKET